MGSGHRFVGAVAACTLTVLMPAGPARGHGARAHGALENPPSRAVVCGPEGGAARSAVCRAAAAAGEPGAPARFDELRVPNVNGRDRALIPDGKLCGAGLTSFAGLDLPRADWPATRLRSGARIAFRYRVTIPHRGTFRLYLTRPGYDPARRLTWSALESRPFLTVTDPAPSKGFYPLDGRLPAGRTGRALIYAIWQTSDTPDTYYSCSDVDFGTPPQAKAPPQTPRRRTRATAGAKTPSRPPAQATDAEPVAGTSTAPNSPSPYIRALGGAAAAFGTLTVIVYALRRFRPPTR
ncbi:lytic polysaccharide monooxygenase [Actinocorallia longicatena]|uniref:Lytic polysaccharide monooxygenase n=1 Tax=Actinocorallia longicatena TaxID=111803 RepID=A0ABP6QG05_9ACTN